MSSGLSRNLRRIAYSVAELPGVRLLAKPLYRYLFTRDVLPGNSYCGIYANQDDALAGAPKSLPTSFDLAPSGDLYSDHLDNVRSVDYPVLFWLSRLISGRQCKVFDLGGNIGTSYYGFRQHFDYPDDLSWLVHDVPAVITAGRDWADRHDVEKKLDFTGSRTDADGYDVLLSAGVLQYLAYTLPELLAQLRDPPRHVLINMTPLHPDCSYVTLQRITRQGVGLANCPYRVSAIGPFVAEFEAQGYVLVDRWESTERYMHIPFEEASSIDRYYGFYFRKN